MHANAEIIRLAYHAFNSADLGGLNELLDDNTSWQTPGLTAVAGHRKGRNEVLAHFERYKTETGGTFRAELMHLFADESGRAVGIHRNTARRNGRTLDTECCITFGLRNGRIAAGKEHIFNFQNWERFWA